MKEKTPEAVRSRGCLWLRPLNAASMGGRNGADRATIVRNLFNSGGMFREEGSNFIPEAPKF